jgi:hypothetical protein
MRYMLSVAGNYNFLDFIANAKSGEFFFFSHDERFMIKVLVVLSVGLFEAKSDPQVLLCDSDHEAY